jgi:hypothetical protein
MEYADQMPPQVSTLPWSLIAIAAAAGVLMMVVFKLASNPAAIRRAKRRVQAQLLALRLFGDEPALVWRAQVGLLWSNLRYLAVMLVPIGAAAIPFALAYPHLDALYGKAALPVGAETVLTVRLHRPLVPVRLETPAGLSVETPGVRIADAGGGEISWRLRAMGPVVQPVRLEVAGQEVTKTVQVGSGRGFLDETRPAGWPAWASHPGETPIGGGGIDSVRVAYRGMRLRGLGLECAWEAWFVGISLVSALLVKSRLGVVV